MATGGMSNLLIGFLGSSSGSAIQGFRNIVNGVLSGLLDGCMHGEDVSIMSRQVAGADWEEAGAEGGLSDDSRSLPSLRGHAHSIVVVELVVSVLECL